MHTHESARSDVPLCNAHSDLENQLHSKCFEANKFSYCFL